MAPTSLSVETPDGASRNGKMNGGDLRVAIAVHKAGSYAAAAATLGIDEITVARRLSRLYAERGKS